MAVQLVDKVDKLLDGDAGSRRLVNDRCASVYSPYSLCPPLAERSLRPATPCS